MSNLRIAVLISGAGTTLDNLIQWENRGELPVDFQVVISSNGEAAGLRYAKETGIPFEVICRQDYPDTQTHSQRVFAICRERDVELVVMGGYLEYLHIPPEFVNRVINVHPSLIPAFSGKGFYGLKVHQAALDFGVKLSGCTIHYVDNEYDHGPIIAQRTCPVFELDSAESLQCRVAELERQLYPEVIAAIARGQVTVAGRHVHLRVIV
jgi:phosphoribosylglycinamide formyltransferase 1